MNAYNDKNSGSWCEAHVTVDVIAMETSSFKVKHVCAGIISALPSAVTRTMPSLNINRSTCAVIIQHYVNACSILQRLSFQPHRCSRKLTPFPWSVGGKVSFLSCGKSVAGEHHLSATPPWIICSTPVGKGGLLCFSTCAAITQPVHHPAVVIGCSPLAMPSTWVMDVLRIFEDIHGWKLSMI